MAARESPDEGRRRALIAFLVLTAVVLALDLASKWATFRYLEENVSYTLVPGCLDFHLSRNEGAVFGIGKGMRPVFIAFAFVASAGILWAQRRHGASSKLLNAGLAFLLGGALGNLYDRLFIGKVRDFIDAYVRDSHWPTFNAADIAICVGCGLVVLYSFRTPKEDGGRKTADR